MATNWIWEGKHAICATCDSQPRHNLDGFVMGKEQFEFFKEPKEHFLPRTVLYRTLKTKERRQHSCI